MENFLSTGFLLGLAGIVITLSLSMLDYFRSKQRSRVVLALLLTGSIVLVVQAVLSEQSRQEKSILDAAKSELLKAINRDVEHVRSVVDEMNTRLANVALSDVGTELITVKAESETARGMEILTYGKGNAAQWMLYADWLSNISANPDKAACLTLDFTVEHHYLVSMLLAYLLTSQGAAENIREAIDTGDVYNNFPSEAFLKQYGIRPKELNCVLFYQNNKVIAYADADRFATELLAYQRAGQSSDVEKMLNDGTPNQPADLKAYFSSVQTNILGTRNKIVSTMLQQRVSQVTVQDNNRLYQVDLAQLVKLVND